jgi:membrane protein implicated in regulation of membrane protease activity
LFGFFVAVGINASGFAVHYAYLPNWFVLRRGLAFGVITAATGANNILVSLYQRLISSIGWQSAYGVLAAIVVVAILSLAAFVIRRTPQEKGCLPDGVAGNLRGKISGEVEANRADLLIADMEWARAECTLGRALKANRFWFIFLSRFCFGFFVNLIMGHQPIYCQDIGFSATFAATVFGLARVYSSDR